MDVTVLLLKVVGKPLTTFLLKRFLEDFADPVVELVDIAASKLESHLAQRQAPRVFESIGDQIVQQLAPLFDNAIKRGEVNVEAVACVLGETLKGPLAPEFFLEQDLDSARLAQAFRQGHPFPSNQFSEAETSLYERALDMAVRCLVEVAHQLPCFNQKLAAEQLKRLSRMQDDFARALEGIGRLEQAITASAPGGQYSRFEADYRQSVSRAVDYLDLFGVDVEPQSRRYQLSVAYISLTLQASSEGTEGSALVPAELLFEQLPLRQGRLLIRGYAGSGKSTLLRWAALMAASSGALLPKKPAAGFHPPRSHVDLDNEGQGASDWYTRIPVLIRLRDCKNGRIPPLSEFAQHTSRFLESPPPGWIQSALEQGRALVLLDGVDEVPRIDRHAIYADIENLVRMYQGCYYVLSTRPAAVEQDWLKPLGFHEASLNPLSTLDRDRLIDRWHEAVARELERAGKPSAGMRALADGLKAQLLQNPAIAWLATNPLLAAVICALHQKRQQSLPKNQSELCEALCHMLLERREKESHLDASVASDVYRSLTYSQKKQLVSELAHYMVLNERSTVEEEEALGQLAKVLDTIPGHSRDDASAVLKDLIERSGMLREARPGTIDFIHNTFKEYLAAYLFARNGDYGLLAKNATDSSWQHVLLFSASEMSGQVGFAEKLITQVLKATDPQFFWRSSRDGKKRQFQLMAIRLQAAAQFLSKTLESRLESSRSELFPPRTLEEAEAIAFAGDVVVPFLGCRGSNDEQESAASVRALRLIASPKARACLREYLEDSRPAVIEELAQSINPLEIKAVQKRLLGGQDLSRGIRSQISDLTPLAFLTVLQSLDLSGTQVSDLAPLAFLTVLQSLDLSGTQVSDLAPLAFLTVLQSLDLSGTQVSDLAPLASLTALQSLHLSGTQVSGLAPLASLTALQSLHLSGTQVSDLAPLASLTALQSLHLTGTQVSDLAPLASLTALQSLHLSHTQVSDLSSLASLTALRSLHLTGTQVSDLSPLASLSMLRSLHLSGTQVSDLSPLASLTALESLDLTGTLVRDFTPLKNLRNLKVT
ncbi:NACHT domain-containing protein [Archangium violaceum]|uniref:NACHT domain-containing protein n=1 Tax=Archangium violaceum TaxID=83451 RepID=UPI0036DF0823